MLHRNNIVSSSLAALEIEPEAKESLLSSPDNFLSTLSVSERESIQAVLLPAYKRGFRIIFLVMASLAALSFVFAWFLMPQVRLERDDDAKLKEEGLKESEKVKG